MAHVPRRARPAALALAPVLLVGPVGASARGPEPPPAPCPVSPGQPLPLPLRALDLAFLGPDRLVALDASEAALFALGPGATLLSRRPLPGPLETVRAPGGFLQASERDAAAWAMTSRGARAVLFAVEAGELLEREQADALPFPATPRGLRFRSGTNLVEGEIEGFGAGPFLDVVASDPPVAVSAEGRLLAHGVDGEALRVGPTLAPLWPGLVAASTASPPGEEDAVLVIAVPDRAVLMRCPAPGAVRAIAARLRGDQARLAVALDDVEGRSSLLLFDIPRPRP